MGGRYKGLGEVGKGGWEGWFSAGILEVICRAVYERAEKCSVGAVEDVSVES